MVYLDLHNWLYEIKENNWDQINQWIQLTHNTIAHILVCLYYICPHNNYNSYCVNRLA